LPLCSASICPVTVTCQGVASCDSAMPMLLRKNTSATKNRTMITASAGEAHRPKVPGRWSHANIYVFCA